MASLWATLTSRHLVKLRILALGSTTPSMSTHVTKVTSSCFYFIHNIRRIRKYLLNKLVKHSSTLWQLLVSTTVIVFSMVTPRHFYLDSNACQTVHPESRFSPSKPLLYNLHWLPIKYRITSNIHFFKC